MPLNILNLLGYKMSKINAGSGFECVASQRNPFLEFIDMSNDFKFMPKSWPVGVAGAFPISLALSYFAGETWPNAIISAAISSIAAFAVIFFLGRRDARLAERMSVRASLAWDVWMNGVKIGVITDAQYAAIQRAAFGDGSLVVAQALNLGQVALDIAGKVFVGVPLTMFWLLAAASVAAPESITGLAALRSADLAALVTSSDNLLRLVGVVTAMSVILLFAFGHRFGFCNCYGEAVARMVRQQCGVPSEGDIRLSKVEMTADVATHN